MRVTNVGLDGIFLAGEGNSTYNNELTVTRSDVSGSLRAGIHIQDFTQAILLDNNCHHNRAGIWLASAWASVNAPAIVMGAIAPASVNGVTITNCPCSANSTIPSVMGISNCNGELVLHMV